VIAGVAVALAALAAAVPLTLRLRRRGRRRRQAEAGLEQRVQSLPPPDTPPVPAPATEESVVADVVAELLVVDGAAGAGRYQLTGAPATIGFTPDCTIVLGHDHVTGRRGCASGGAKANSCSTGCRAAAVWPWAAAPSPGRCSRTATRSRSAPGGSGLRSARRRRRRAPSPRARLNPNLSILPRRAPYYRPLSLRRVEGTPPLCAICVHLGQAPRG